MERLARAEPAAGPSRREILGYGGLLAAILAGLFHLEIGSGGTQPVAVLLSMVIVYAFLCVARLEAAFALILGLTPFSFEFVVPGTGSAMQVPTEPMILVALAVWGLRFLSRGSTTFRQPLLTTAFVLGLIACVVSLYDTAHPENGIKATLNATWYGLFGVFIYNNFRDRSRLESLTAWWLLTGLVICLYSLGSVIAGNFIPAAGYWHADPFFLEHGTFSAYLSFVCMLALALAINAEGPGRAGWALIGLLSGAQVVLSLTRGAWLGLAAGIVFLAVASGHRLRRGATIMVGAAGILAVLVAILYSGAQKGIETHGRLITDSSYVSNLERINRWYAGWRMFQDDPLTGVGYGTYPAAYAGYRRFPLGTEQSTYYMSVHSEYLRVLSETGLLGVIACLVASAVLFAVGRRAIRRTSDPYLRALAIGTAAGLVTYLVHGAVNNFLAYDKVAVPVWAAIGILAAIDAMNAE